MAADAARRPAPAQRRTGAARPRRFAGRRGGAGRCLNRHRLARAVPARDAVRQHAAACAGGRRAAWLCGQRRRARAGAAPHLDHRRAGAAARHLVVPDAGAGAGSHAGRPRLYPAAVGARPCARRRGRHPAPPARARRRCGGAAGQRARAREAVAAGLARPATRDDVGRTARRRRLRHLRRGRSRSPGGRPPGGAGPPAHRLHRRPHRGFARASRPCRRCCSGACR